MYTSTVLRVETICMPRADGCGSPGADLVLYVATYNYHESMTMSLENYAAVNKVAYSSAEPRFVPRPHRAHVNRPFRLFSYLKEQ